MNSATKPTRLIFQTCLLAALMLAFTGCKTIPQSSVVSWREAVQTAKDQSRVTFEAVGLLIRESQLDRIEMLPPDQLKHLREEYVAPGLPPQALRQWNIALDAMAAYASSVEMLLSPDLPQNFADSLKRTGEQIGATGNIGELKSDKELSRAIGALGKQIVAASANRKAQEVMLQIDPAVRELTGRMANMLYEAVEKTDEEGKPIVRESGVIVTARATWEDKLTVVQEKFRDTTQGSARRDLAEQFAAMLDQQAELEESIMALRRGMIDLGAAHTAAAQGRETDVRTLVASMREDIKLVSDVAESLKKDKE